ncbi:MAG: TolC family outer membrane protein [Legionellales bacterium]|nr:TolC family outer membrane protein [Legionellales bacterium]
MQQQQTLARVMAETLNTNPTILKTEANELATHESIIEAQSGLLPRIDASVAQGRENTNSLSTAFTDRYLTRQERQITVSQLLWDAWGTINQVRSRNFQYQASHFQTAEQKELTALRVTEVYLDMIRFKALLDLANHNVMAHRETLRKVTLRYKGGAGQKADADLADSRLAQAVSTLLASQGLVDNARATYQSVTGLDPQQLSLPQTPRLPKNLTTALNIAYTTSPAITVAKKNIQSALANIKVARAGLWPRISFESTISRNKNLDGLLGHSNEELAMIMMRYNIYNGGANVAAIRKAVFNYESAYQTLQEVKRTVTENVTTAWNDYQITSSRVIELSRRVDNTRLVLNAYEKQFELGQRSLLNLVDTERELFNAKSDLINARFLAQGSAYRLLASMGTLENNVLYEQ